jgi:hypothetical protein
LIRKITIGITTLWVINELAQFTEILHESHVLKFFIVHLSSLYGAIIFCFLINELKLKRILFACPVFIEIFQSWSSCGCFDFTDILFSIIGISIAQTILLIENKKKRLMI